MEDFNPNKTEPDNREHVIIDRRGNVYTGHNIYGTSNWSDDPEKGVRFIGFSSGSRVNCAMSQNGAHGFTDVVTHVVEPDKIDEGVELLNDSLSGRWGRKVKEALGL